MYTSLFLYYYSTLSWQKKQDVVNVVKFMLTAVNECTTKRKKLPTKTSLKCTTLVVHPVQRGKIGLKVTRPEDHLLRKHKMETVI